MVAPVTRTVRGIPTEIPVGVEEGLPDIGVASFDNLQVVLRRELTDKAGELEPGRELRICEALGALADC